MTRFGYINSDYLGCLADFGAESMNSWNVSLGWDHGRLDTRRRRRILAIFSIFCGSIRLLLGYAEHVTVGIFEPGDLRRPIWRTPNPESILFEKRIFFELHSSLH